MPQFTIDIPDDKVEMVGRAFRIIKGQYDPAETDAQAWTRLKERLILSLRRKVISMRQRELSQAQVTTDATNSIGEA